MKFRIRFADQIVGLIVILGLAALVFVIIMLGRSQRWFAKDRAYTTSFASAAGLSNNMAVQFRGFAIGSLKSFILTDDNTVEAKFIIYENYLDRVKNGSLVELMVSPIGLGNQFLFHPGRGEPLEEDAFIPSIGTPEAQALIEAGLADAPQRDDSISLLLNRVSSVLDIANRTLIDVDNAFKGTDTTSLGRIVGSLETTLSGAKGLPSTVNTTLADVNLILESVAGTIAAVQPVLADVKTLTAKLNDPSGLVYTVLDTNAPVYQNLVNSLSSLSNMLKSLDKTISFVPGQLPQVGGLLQDLRTTLASVEDVLTALANNPLLKKGVPERVQSESSGAPLRDVEF
ncbi:MAG: MlaD family protein [Treponema sp.]|jgi:phospholipid/cholesterol/gamma-HCH transport system substrate-binding protein|nr:MlaD family protein [Treponema sp.]